MKRKIRSTANIYDEKAALSTRFQRRVKAKYNGKLVGNFYLNRWGVSAYRPNAKTATAEVPWRELIEAMKFYNGRTDED
jgi:hypothetical protein